MSRPSWDRWSEWRRWPARLWVVAAIDILFISVLAAALLKFCGALP